MVLIFPSEQLRFSLSIFFLFTKKETPAGVHLIATSHVISFSRKLLVRRQTAGITSHCISRCGWQRICRTASPFGVHINFWPPAEMMSWNRGRWAFWQRLQRRPATSGSGQFRPLCQVYGDFSLECNHCVKQVSMSFMVYMLFFSSVIQIIKILDQYKIFLNR